MHMKSPHTERSVRWGDDCPVTIMWLPQGRPYPPSPPPPNEWLWKIWRLWTKARAPIEFKTDGYIEIEYYHYHKKISSIKTWQQNLFYIPVLTLKSFGNLFTFKPASLPLMGGGGSGVLFNVFTSKICAFNVFMRVLTLSTSLFS